MKQSYASAGKAPRRRVHSPSGIAAIAVCGLPPPRIVIGYPGASSAVRYRTLGDPRVVPGFRYPFCPGIPSSPTPGSSIIVSSSAAMSTRPSPRVDRLGTPKTPAIRFTRAMTFVASWFTHLLRSASLLAPCTDLTGYPASGAFTSGLSAGWSPFPLQDITTTATGLLCWRDSHPLEWQLASLHLLLHRSGLSPHTPCQSPGALTRVTACTLAPSPIRDALSEGFSYFVTSIAAPVASGWSVCRVGLAPTGKRRLVTAHPLNRRHNLQAWGVEGGLSK